MNHSLYTATVSKLLVAALSAALALGFLPAFASTGNDDTLLAGAKLCTQYLPRHEREYGIPVHLLAAIASTESGRYHRSLGLNLPWPWTINVEGRGYFFNTKEEAIAAVQHFQSRGIQSIDVGCMQVNLHHHPNAFANLEQAFDPAYNVAYAAQFLKQNFVDEGSWRKATADYHSHTQAYGDPYVRMVYGAWSRIINKVADARAGRPVSIASAEAEPDIHYHDAAAAASAAAIALAAQQQTSSYQSPHMHVISVSNVSRRENGVLVIRPDKGDTLQPTTQDQPESFVTTQKKSQTAQDNSDAHAVVQGAQRATPITTMADNTFDAPSSSEAKVIHVGSASDNSNNLTGSTHSNVIHIGGSSSAGSSQNSSTPDNSMFVFN